ncbi:hypothetical protein BH24ACI3_BH24ACI3_08380 [soil metagenome]
MKRLFKSKIPPDLSFRHTVESHGWYDLAPFEYDATAKCLKYAMNLDNGQTAEIEFAEVNGKIFITADDNVDRIIAVGAFELIFRLDEGFAEFYQILGDGTSIAWASEARAGRLLRSVTVWEDLVKTMCTTNCSWGLTKKMVGNLVENLGSANDAGKKAFPTPEAMASVNVEFYREAVRAGYRSPYFMELAEAVAAGSIDPEVWLDSELPTVELKRELEGVKGIGDYAAENMLKLLGRYDGLALDSWLRGGFYKKHNRGKVCPDKKIERHYARYGDWRGLAIWCDMTKDWFEKE